MKNILTLKLFLKISICKITFSFDFIFAFVFSERKERGS